MKEDWNIDKYRNKFEPEEQWQLKRKFMETHKHLFPKERILCLAQVLVNMEVLGAKYPAETMRTVTKLSKNIVKEFREKQKSRLQRTFVEASDAASAKIKGIRPASTSQCEIGKDIAGSNAKYFMAAILSSNSKNIADNGKAKNQDDTTQQNPSPATSSANSNNVESSKKKKRKKEKRDAEKNSAMDTEPDQCMITADPPQTNTIEEAFVEPPSKKLKSTRKKDRAIPRIPNFVIIMHHADKKKIPKHAIDETSPTLNYRAIMESSARLSSVHLEVKKRFLRDQAKWESVLHLGGREIASSLHENEKLSQRGVYPLAFSILQNTHYQIVVTDTTCISVHQFLTQVEDFRQAQAENSITTTITKDVMVGKSNGSSSSPLNSALEILSKTENIVEKPVNSTAAMKMMKMMGWTEGTGLGVKQQGIVEPIKSDVVVDRKGIGYNASESKESFIKLIRRYLTNYSKSLSLHNIIFSNEFSNEQRKLIHSVAHRMGMHSMSVGKVPNRQVTVRRSRCEIRPLVELLNQLIESEGADPLFEKLYLIPPLI